MQNLYKNLETLLKSDERFVSKDGKELLLKNLIQQKVSEMDAGLIKLLLSDELLKKHFFAEIDEMLIFDKAKFIDFIYNKEFLKDSYTMFANKIGLMDDKQFIKEQKEVVLARPYKDCILEGGQDKEDVKRNEIFHNMTLAPDQITRLLKPKVLTNREHYSTDGEKQLTASDVKNLDFSKENLIIKGNNLLVLHSLKERFAGKVKLIYIDPPYNTGNDSFGYNDSFNHSTWLTFMKNRLEVAKELLTDDGYIFISVDDHEQHYLCILMDEIFGQKQYVQTIHLKKATAQGFKTVNPGPINVTEYVVIYTKQKSKMKRNPTYIEGSYHTDFSNFITNVEDNYKNWNIVSLKDLAYKKLNVADRKEAKVKFGEKYKNIIVSVMEEIATEYPRQVFSTLKPNNPSSSLQKIVEISKEEKEKIFEYERDDKENIYIQNGRVFYFYANKLRLIDGELKPSELVTDWRGDISFHGIGPEGGVSLNNGKKPEKLIKRILDMTTEEGDIVLDYHSGSGTTGAVAHKMKRQWILIEQLDYIKDLPQQRLKNVIDGDETGISKIVERKGGGSFVYAEIKTRNQTILDQINTSNDNKELISIRNEMREGGFLSVKVDLKKFDEYFDKFTDLSIEDKKAFLIESLDKNMLYVPVGEIDDTKYQISDDDKALTNAFYNRTEK